MCLSFANSHAVYLIFGTNKSGRFYGYVRMANSINESSVNVQRIKEKDMHSNAPNHEDLSSSSIKVRSFPALGSLRQETVYEEVDRKSAF